MFWVHASNGARFEEGYRKIAGRVKLHGWDDSRADILWLVSNWLCDRSNGRWLMIIDNADDADVFSNVSRARPITEGSDLVLVA